MRNAIVACLLFLSSCASTSRPSSSMDRIRRIYQEARVVLTLGEVVAVGRGTISPADGDRVLAALDALQAALDAGSTAGDWAVLQSLGDTLIDQLGISGDLRPAEVQASHSMLKLLLNTIVPPGTRPAAVR